MTSRSSFACCVCVLTSACFSVPEVDDDDNDNDTSSSGTDGSTTSATETTTAPPSDESTSGASSSGDDAPMTTAVDSSSDGGNPICGDGIVDPEEDCDDDNDNDGDGCSACMVDEGYQCQGDAPSVCTMTMLCGDGMVEGPEACDDGNGNNGDGCSSTCAVEMYSRCVGEGPGSCNAIRILFVLADEDATEFRDEISMITGEVVDYFDARTSTPTLVELDTNYDCVMTHPQSVYDDGMALGSALASFVDAGGNVVLGLATDMPDLGMSGSTIMTPAYSPVSTGPQVQFLKMPAQYNGDGSTLIHDGVGGYGLQIMDESVVLQGAGIQDGSYDNGEIASAYRPDFKVVYLNGSGHPVISPTGDWARLFANGCAVGFVQ